MKELDTKEVEQVAGGGLIDTLFNVVNGVTGAISPDLSNGVKTVEQGVYSVLGNVV
ncbi:hypothetical protein [Rouxiella badensis]|jgi:hypothetical protein|uniref:hypothetical protein n=1 Tax=Rouxiella badensis TaxID=1646377 RepID=UPI0003813CB0|nr:hypothetical protein [Rouxiella badensis]MCC3718195.1 hypothetical protein [Rouxiella badensis]MCC3727037.1 hypothetical protein [Rouxiella badensis]MCC3738614.1 hypothetical protein [Rouxiella badensis]QII38651.1 hypothetical protein G3M83_13695 [Rouxiella badensis]QOI55227.1 hypothetical protein H2866_20305 [Rouxiella badensis subsp. acadiensis]